MQVDGWTIYRLWRQMRMRSAFYIEIARVNAAHGSSWTHRGSVWMIAIRTPRGGGSVIQPEQAFCQNRSRFKQKIAI